MSVKAIQGSAMECTTRRTPVGSGMAMPASPLPDTVVKFCLPSKPRWMANTVSAKNVRIQASDAARPWSYCAPTMAKKISVDSTENCPPTTMGLPKSAMLSIKPTKNALARPGLSSGRVTVMKVRCGLARSVWAASSRLGATPCTTPRIIMKAMGVNAKVCATQMPSQP
ncbi:hypothetical protein D3C71_1221270 [compost metagenome]